MTAALPPVRKKSKRVGLGQLGTVTKGCKRGERVLSGSFATERGGRDLAQASRTRAVDAGGVGNAIARCKGRRKAVSGGFAGAYAPAGPLILSHTSRRRGGAAWSVEGWNLGSGPGSVIGYVYCAKRL
ncbi:MAG TPA: hypothetical protein VK919_06605 [Solirubrobacterales bacterium]|nr:hypothetical protein [Solirubrobacterales bacterium]